MRLLVFLCVLCVVCCEEEKVFRVVGDSYLEAFKETHGEIVNDLFDQAVKVTDREYSEPYPYPTTQYGQPQPAYNYGPPQTLQKYGSPLPQYGPPNSGLPPPPPPPPPPPAPVYGPSEPAPIYGPPNSNVQVFYGVPHALGSIWDKLKLKLDLFILGKILLKLIIFKKIVSFIAIICLLLFIPSLKKKIAGSSEDDSLMRSLSKEELADEKINNITSFVLAAIENFPMDKHSENCKNAYCKVIKMDKRLSYKKLAKLYSKEMQ